MTKEMNDKYADFDLSQYEIVEEIVEYEETEEKDKVVKKKTVSAAKKEEIKNAEKIISASTSTAPHGKFVIKKTAKGFFVYKLFSSNHKVVAIGGENYSAIATCKAGIASVMRNAAVANIENTTLKTYEEQKNPKWQIYVDKRNEIRLRLFASNGNIVATTNDGYLSVAAAKKGIEAIAKASVEPDIVRNDILW